MFVKQYDYQIQKYVTWSNAKILTNCFTDDLNVVTASLSSLITCLFYINKYKEAAGLQINVNKTKGFFFDKRHIFKMEHYE